MRRCMLIPAIVAGVTSGAAAVVLTVPTVAIQPAPHQAVPILLTGGTQGVIAATLCLALPAGPVFEGVIAPGPIVTIWPDPDVLITPDGREMWVDKSFGPVQRPVLSADGVLLTVLLDATGTASGDYALLFTNSFGSSSLQLLGVGTVDCGDVVGTIRVVPEPASACLLAAGLVRILPRRYWPQT